MTKKKLEDLIVNCIDKEAGFVIEKKKLKTIALKLIEILTNNRILPK